MYLSHYLMIPPREVEKTYTQPYAEKTSSRGVLKTPKIGKYPISGLEKSTSWIFFCISWIFLFLKWMLTKYVMDFSEIDMNFGTPAGLDS